MLLLLKAQPVLRRHVLRPSRLRAQPRLDRFAQVVVLAIFVVYETRQANPLINVIRISNRAAAPLVGSGRVIGTAWSCNDLRSVR